MRGRTSARVLDDRVRRDCALQARAGLRRWFLTGTDEHGQKIERSAKAAELHAAGVCRKVSAEFRALWDRLGLTYDDFIRTTEPRHKRGVQKLFTAAAGARLHLQGHLHRPVLRVG